MQFRSSRNIFYIFIVIFAIIYSLPNFFGETPAIQLKTSQSFSKEDLAKTLGSNQISPTRLDGNDKSWLLRFQTTEEQLNASKLINKKFPNWVNALNLANNTPEWLSFIGAVPMKLGLDLRGGVHFLLNVDIHPVINQRIDADIKEMMLILKQQKIKFQKVQRNESDYFLKFRNQGDVVSAKKALSVFKDFNFVEGKTSLSPELSATALKRLQDDVMQHTIQILSNRVNELGVSEVVVQQQGDTMVSIDLPGIQDTAKAKSLLGSNATIAFQLVADPSGERQPPGTKWYVYENRKVLLYETPILTGSSITYASSDMSDQGHIVHIRLGGGGEKKFYRITSENVGNQLAVLYTEKKINNAGGQMRWVTNTDVISVATINQALGNSFEINHLDSAEYAQNLSLLLRSGALTAPFEIVEETLIGPSMGLENIQKGLLSLFVGFMLINLFMALYYRTLGFIADIALFLNLLFLMAFLSILGNTLTLAGIAGIVLTVGMAVDANVLINERIREEFVLGNTLEHSIEMGYEKAFATIMDANLTTLIVAFILFGLGSGTIKGFAVTLILGLISSMITSIFISRLIVDNCMRYFGKINIGIK